MWVEVYVCIAESGWKMSCQWWGRKGVEHYRGDLVSDKSWLVVVPSAQASQLWNPLLFAVKADLLWISHVLFSHCRYEDPEGSEQNGKPPKEAFEPGALDGLSCPGPHALTWTLPTGMLGRGIPPWILMGSAWGTALTSPLAVWWSYVALHVPTSRNKNACGVV